MPSLCILPNSPLPPDPFTALKTPGPSDVVICRTRGSPKANEVLFHEYFFHLLGSHGDTYKLLSKFEKSSFVRELACDVRNSVLPGRLRYQEKDGTYPEVPDYLLINKIKSLLLKQSSKPPPKMLRPPAASTSDTAMELVPKDDDVLFDKGGHHHNTPAKRLFVFAKQFVTESYKAGAKDSMRKLIQDCIVLDEATFNLIGQPQLWANKSQDTNISFFVSERKPFNQYTYKRLSEEEVAKKVYNKLHEDFPTAFRPASRNGGAIARSSHAVLRLVVMALVADNRRDSPPERGLAKKLQEEEVALSRPVSYEFASDDVHVNSESGSCDNVSDKDSSVDSATFENRHSESSNWTATEDSILREKRVLGGLTWDETAKFLPGRSGSACSDRFLYLSRQQKSAARNPPSAPLASSNQTRGQNLSGVRRESNSSVKIPAFADWTEEEDKVLREKCAIIPPLTCKEIAQCLHPRTVGAVSSRMSKLKIPRKTKYAASKSRQDKSLNKPVTKASSPRGKRALGGLPFDEIVSNSLPKERRRTTLQSNRMTDDKIETEMATAKSYRTPSINTLGSPATGGVGGIATDILLSNKRQTTSLRTKRKFGSNGNGKVSHAKKRVSLDWTDEEDRTLKELSTSIPRLSDKDIALHMHPRTEGAVSGRISKLKIIRPARHEKGIVKSSGKSRDRDVAPSRLALGLNLKPAAKRGRGSRDASSHAIWTASHDHLILKMKKKNASWNDIVVHFPGRTIGACKKRYSLLQLNKVSKRSKRKGDNRVKESKNGSKAARTYDGTEKHLSKRTRSTKDATRKPAASRPRRKKKRTERPPRWTEEDRRLVQASHLMSFPRRHT